jgi:hypothetical protein
MDAFLLVEEYLLEVKPGLTLILELVASRLMLH